MQKAFCEVCGTPKFAGYFFFRACAVFWEVVQRSLSSEKPLSVKKAAPELGRSGSDHKDLRETSQIDVTQGRMTWSRS